MTGLPGFHCLALPISFTGPASEGGCVPFSLLLWTVNGNSKTKTKWFLSRPRRHSSIAGGKRVHDLSNKFLCDLSKGSYNKSRSLSSDLRPVKVVSSWSPPPEPIPALDHPRIGRHQKRDKKGATRPRRIEKLIDGTFFVPAQTAQNCTQMAQMAQTAHNWT